MRRAPIPVPPPACGGRSGEGSLATVAPPLRPSPARGGGGRRFSPPISALPLAVALAVLALLAEYTPIDRWVLDQFYDPLLGTFPARRAFWAQTLLHDGQSALIILVALAALAVLLGSFAAARLRELRRPALYILACVALTTSAVGGLKRVSALDCPWDLDVYGGERAYVHLFAPRPTDADAGRCFPGGHSSGAFSLLALVVLMRRRRSRHAPAALAGVLVLGLSYASLQWLRGAHFPSHDLWSAWIAWTCANALAPVVLGRARAAVAVATPRRRGARAPLAAAAVAGCLAVLALTLPSGARAAAVDGGWATVREIDFRGNDVTQPQVMLREIEIRVGDPADPARIERSRQAILDLGLFRAVEAVQEPLADGVRVVFVVKEKWYILPYPRLSMNSDGQDALGAEIRWNNVGGLNHSLRALVSSADRREEGRGRQLGYMASYRAPFLFGTPYTLDLKGSHTTTPIDALDGTDVSYDESIDEFQVLAGRKFGDAGAASQGWSAGGGLLWRSQNTDGADAPAPWGDTYALVAQVAYRDEHDHVYSEEGTVFGTRYEIADQNLLSDYSYTRATLQYKRSIALGSTPHQTFEYGFQLGSANGGRSQTPPFALGGTQGLRGYARNSFEGSAYYLASASYLRPIGWDWLRLVATVEAGNVYAEADDINTEVRWSFGLGLRIRVPRLVGVEIETGIALPLSNDSARFYGYRNGF